MRRSQHEVMRLDRRSKGGGAVQRMERRKKEEYRKNGKERKDTGKKFRGM
jgi:hypothetical protein